VTEAPAAFAHLLGKRVLPLRGNWQQYVDCPAEYAIPVPDEVHSHLAARAYINPLAARMMLNLYPPQGKRVLLTAQVRIAPFCWGSGRAVPGRKRYTVFTARRSWRTAGGDGHYPNRSE
jgi:hypothetical protein